MRCGLGPELTVGALELWSSTQLNGPRIRAQAVRALGRTRPACPSFRTQAVPVAHPALSLGHAGMWSAEAVTRGTMLLTWPAHDSRPGSP